MGKVFISLGGGGGVGSDELTATSANVLTGQKYVGSDTNDEIGIGTMADKSGTTQEATATLDTANSRVQLTVPVTGKYDNAAKLYAAYSTLASLLGVEAAKMLTTETILGVQGSIPSLSEREYFATTEVQRISAGQYLSGRQKIHALSQSNLSAGNIRSGVKITVNNGSTDVFSVTGTLAVTSAINFKATAQSATVIRISWTNPSKGPWEGVEIRMSTSGNPGVSGGTQKYKGKGNNATAGGSNYVDITGLSAGTTHYFTCTSYATGLGNGSSYNVSAKTTGLLLYSYGNNPAGFTYTYNSSAGVSGNGITFKSDHILVDSGSCRTIYSSVYKETLYKSYTRLCADIIFPNAITPQYDSWTGYIRLHAGISNTDGSSSVYSEASIPSAGSLTTFKTSLANASSGNSNNGLDVYIEVAWKTGSTVRNYTYPQAKYYRIWLE